MEADVLLVLMLVVVLLLRLVVVRVLLFLVLRGHVDINLGDMGCVGAVRIPVGDRDGQSAAANLRGRRFGAA